MKENKPSELDKWFKGRKEFWGHQYPWQRQYLVTEFLKIERDRIQQVDEWYKGFQNAIRGSAIKQVEMFVLPTRLSRVADIDSNTHLLVLSALRNSIQKPVIALFDFRNQTPRDYQLIRLTKGTVDHILIGNRQDLTPIKVVVVGDYELLDPLSIYPKETPKPELLSRFFSSNFYNVSPFPESLQTILMSSPPEHMVGGGISFASEYDKRTNANRIGKSLQYVLPPEFRGIKPPKSVYKGRWDDVEPGIQAKVAERIIGVDSRLESKVTNSIESLLNHAKARQKYKGELSTVGGLHIGGMEDVKDASRLINSFFNFEVSLYGLEDALDLAAPLPEMLSQVDEELWIALMNQRALSPSLTNLTEIIDKQSKEVSKWVTDELKSSWGFALASRMQESIPNNLEREAQAIARSRYHSIVEEDDIENAVNNLKLRIDLVFTEDTRDIFDELPRAVGKDQLKRLKLLAITGYLQRHPSNIQELWASLESEQLIESNDELESLVDILRKDGEIYIGTDGRYRLAY